MAIDRALLPAQTKIAIVGKAPSSLALAPYHDDTWQIWTLSDLVLCGQALRYDVQFELHAPELLKARPPYWDWLCRHENKPVVMREQVPEVKTCVVFPKDEIVQQYGRYFTNTVSWMIALAMEFKPTHIGVWGVDMACGPEYRAQRPSCEYFLGIAVGRGIEVVLPGECDLLKSAGLYGFDSHHLSDMAAKMKARRDELAKRIAECEQRRDQAALEAAYLQGAKEDTVEYWSQWVQDHGA